MPTGWSMKRMLAFWFHEYGLSARSPPGGNQETESAGASRFNLGRLVNISVFSKKHHDVLPTGNTGQNQTARFGVSGQPSEHGMEDALKQKLTRGCYSALLQQPLNNRKPG